MMVDNNEWQNGYREAFERGRLRVGDPPAPGELVAWSRGEIPEDSPEAERMRERLSYYPELAAALSDDDPADDESPLLTREQLAMDWERIQQRSSPGVGPHVAAAATAPRSQWRWATVVPFATTLLFAGLFLHSLWRIGRLRTELEKPRANVERVELHATVPRGPATPKPIVLQPSTKYVLLALVLDEEVRARSFRVELLDLNDEQPKTLWQSTVSRGADGTFSVEIPRTFLTASSYELALFGDDGSEPIATYVIWLAQSQRPA
ncbi:MAG TPA: hypothetical protein VF618_12495 [Thermoanaerobaculia bacterium]